jgi:hypothetical protein
MRKGCGHRLLSTTPDKNYYEKYKINEPRIKITLDKINQWLNQPSL